jgi:hypothetical protein
LKRPGGGASLGRGLGDNTLNVRVNRILANSIRLTTGHSCFVRMAQAALSA